MLTAQTIKTQHSDTFTFLHGNLEIAASDCRIPEEALLNSLVYVSDAAQLAEARRHKPAILIVPAKMTQCVTAVLDAESCCFSVQSIFMGMAVLLKYFDRKCYRFKQWGERHPTAVVHESAVLSGIWPQFTIHSTVLALPLTRDPIRTVRSGASGRALLSALGQTGRLQLAFGGDAQLSLSEVAPHGVRAELSFPARMAPT